MSVPRYPRDKDTLLKEMDIRLRLGDIRRLHQLRDRLSPRWWEPSIVIILFAAALGLLASLFQYSELRSEPLNKWMLFWFGLMILMTVLAFQIILIRIYNFRRAFDILIQMVEELRKDQDQVQSRLERSEAKDKGSGEPMGGGG